MALEHPGVGFFGNLGKVGVSPTSLDSLELFIRGYLQSLKDLNQNALANDWWEFIDWMNKKGYFSLEINTDWHTQIIKKFGDGEPAFNRFREILFEYLEDGLPSWFVEFNSVEQPSEWFQIKILGDKYENYESLTARSDIRIQKHIDLICHLGANLALAEDEDSE